MAIYQAPEEWTEWVALMSAVMDSRSRHRLPLVMLGMLFASGRRTVTTWLRAALLQQDFQACYYFLQTVGRHWKVIGDQVFMLVLRQVLKDESRVFLVIDDTPTKRYGPQVAGAGIHHNPTPGPSGSEFCYGHVWVTLAVCVRHAVWGSIGLPIWSWLYVRKCDVEKLSAEAKWTFQTKLVQAAELVLRASRRAQAAGKLVWVVADGAYAKRPFVRPLMAEGITVIGRLRKDAALKDLPPVVVKPGRGRPRIYGVNEISLAKRAAHPRGWSEVTCSVYGQDIIKSVKTFLATHETFGGAIRMVIIKEDHGPQFLYCTNLDATVREIIEAFADRSTIEQVFHDVKEVWGADQQQVRHLWSNIGCWHLNLWMFTLTELWAWPLKAQQLTHRDDSPWDTLDRRPSHADKRKALQTQCLQNELSASTAATPLPQKIRDLLHRLLRLAV